MTSPSPPRPPKAANCVAQSPVQHEHSALCCTPTHSHQPWVCCGEEGGLSDGFLRVACMKQQAAAGASSSSSGSCRALSGRWGAGTGRPTRQTVAGPGDTTQQGAGWMGCRVPGGGEGGVLLLQDVSCRANRLPRWQGLGHSRRGRWLRGTESPPPPPHALVQGLGGWVGDHYSR